MNLWKTRMANGDRSPVGLSIATLMTLVVLAVSGGMYMGALGQEVEAVKEVTEAHVKIGAHQGQAIDTATIKNDVAYNKVAIEEIKKELKEQTKQAQEDKKEILEAIKKAND